MQLPPKLVNDFIKRGSILHSTDFKDIDHGKFFVIIGVTDDYVAGLFFINSKIHPSIMCKPELLSMQYPLKASNYSFLKYDSFLSASTIIKKRKQEITKSIEFNMTTYIDSLLQEDLDNVLGMLRESKLYNKKEKELFFY